MIRLNSFIYRHPTSYTPFGARLSSTSIPRKRAVLIRAAYVGVQHKRLMDSNTSSHPEKRPSSPSIIAREKRLRNKSPSPQPVGGTTKDKSDWQLDPASHISSDVTPQDSKKVSQAKKVSGKSKRRKQRHSSPEPCSPEDVVWHDVVSVLGQDTITRAVDEGTDWDSPFGFREEVSANVVALASSGEGLALPLPSEASSSDDHDQKQKAWVLLVPFVLPGETIRARVYRSSRMHSFADLISVEKPNPEMRDDTKVQCKYFGKCSGCQYQMLDYDIQLQLKRTVIVKAFDNFSGLPSTSIPTIQATMNSPLQYGYRTKITPHFEAPPKKVQKAGFSTLGDAKPEWLKIGFNEIGKRIVTDIEECPIATPVLNTAYSSMRANIAAKIHTYKKGASLILRDSLDASASSVDAEHICVTDHNSTVRERVGDMLFEYSGGSFFQNNNSVLVPLTTYVRDAIFPSQPSNSLPSERPTHLVDAYCGAGLFAITLSPYFDVVTGIELSADSIRFATRNATLNNITEGKCTFRAGDSAAIFTSVGDFPRERTVLVIDPPRKGCSDEFIGQLLKFRCSTVVYVSCNVHTQARDIGKILNSDPVDGKQYTLESLRGFDLFPQTAHVESVAVLRLS